MRNQREYDQKYTDLQEKIIPGMEKSLGEFNNIIEMRFGNRLSSDQLPNIQKQYNNSSIYVDWDFKNVGLDPSDNVVRAAIDEDMQTILYEGVLNVVKCTESIAHRKPTKSIIECIDEYNEADRQLWKYNYKDRIVDIIKMYTSNMYESLKAEEINIKGNIEEFFNIMLLPEILDSLNKLGFPEKEKEMFKGWREFISSLKNKETDDRGGEDPEEPEL